MDKTNFIRLKIVLVGNCGIGKTAILVRYVNTKFENVFRSTIGCSFLAKQINLNEKTYSLEIWDTAGQEAYRSILPMYYRNSDIAFLCFDLYDNNISQIKEIIEIWLKELEKYKDNLHRIIYLVGTKSDLVSDNKKNLVKDFLLTYYKNYLYSETSSKNNLGIDNMFIKSIEKYTNIKNIENIKENKNKNENMLVIHEKHNNFFESCMLI